MGCRNVEGCWGFSNCQIFISLYFEFYLCLNFQLIFCSCSIFQFQFSNFQNFNFRMFRFPIPNLQIFRFPNVNFSNLTSQFTGSKCHFFKFQLSYFQKQKKPRLQQIGTCTLQNFQNFRLSDLEILF